MEEMSKKNRSYKGKIFCYLLKKHENWVPEHA